MRKIANLDETLMELNGSPLLDGLSKEIMVKRVIAETIRRGSSVDASGRLVYDSMRAERIAWDIYNADGSIELDDADVAMIEDIVKRDVLLNNMSKSACLHVLQEAPPE